MDTDPPALGASDYLDESFRTWLTALMRKHQVTGFSVAVISKDEIHADGYGFALLPATEVTADTLFPMCSTTKSFTCATLGLLIEEAKSSSDQHLNKHSGLAVLKAKGWNTLVSKIMPDDFITTSPFLTSHLTLADLASHRSGLPGHDFLWGPWQGPDLANSTRNLRHLDPSCVVEPDFRSRMHYNNMMYGVLGHVIETVSGESYDKVLRDRILTPLGMNETWSSIERAKEAIGWGDDVKDRWSRPYYFREDREKEDQSNDADKEESSEQVKSKNDEVKGVYYPSHWTTLFGLDPAGALISSVKDYAKWVQALLEAAKPPPPNDAAADSSNPPPAKAKKSSNPISASLLKTLTSPLITMPSQTALVSSLFEATPNTHPLPMMYAMGWYMDPHFLPGEIFVSHGGGLPGVGTLIAYLPNRDFGIVLAGNSTNANTVIEAVSKELFGRRVGWSEEKRRKHIDPEEAKKKAKESEEAAAKVTEDLPGPVPTDSASAGTATGTLPDTNPFENVNYAGKYTHPAYGTFALTSTNASSSLSSPFPQIHNQDVIRPKDDPKSLDPPYPKTNTPPILSTPLGRRGLQYLHLLHPSPIPSKDVQVHHDSNKHLPLGLETLISHGDFSECPFRELDEGWGNPDDKLCPGPKIEDRKGLWECPPVKAGGGVLEFDDAGKKVRRLGLRLARVEDLPEDEEKGDDDEAEEGGKKEKVKKAKKEKPILEEGWEDRMVWFTRVLDE